MSRKKKKPRRGRKYSAPPSLEPLHIVFPSNREEPPPTVSPKSLSEYHEFLSKQLRFPINALHIEPLANGRFEMAQVVVQRLLTVEEEDSGNGLRVEAKFPDGVYNVPLINIQLPPTSYNGHLISEYTIWYEERRDEDEEAEDEAGEESELSDDSLPSLLRKIFYNFVYGMGAGAVWYAILEAVPGAKTGAIFASTIVGFLGMILGLAANPDKSSSRSIIIKSISYSFIFLVIGAMFGAVIGGLVVAFVGAIPGGIVGSLIGRRLKSTRPLGSYMGGIVGFFLGGLAYAIYLDMEAARHGFGIGMLWGIGCLALLYVLMFGLDVIQSSGEIE